ncbi:hypothetical protein GCM10022403_068720 [Streptomyces coacervatus]|uniref:Uncharacterized protein n=1 Tax=Streptomyces coacervatus TaxID=647381 RepID=A0ABP7IS72_9ACTN
MTVELVMRYGEPPGVTDAGAGTTRPSGLAFTSGTDAAPVVKAPAAASSNMDPRTRAIRSVLLL